MVSHKILTATLKTKCSYLAVLQLSICPK